MNENDDSQIYNNQPLRISPRKAVDFHPSIKS